VTTANLPFCWGSNTEGQGGSNGFLHAVPARVLGGVLFKQITAGAFHTCGTSTSSKGYCWGANGNGQLGDGTAIGRNRPTAIAGGLSFRMVAAGSGLILIPSEEQEQGYSCGITTNDQAYCWGDGSTGVLGAGTIKTQSRTPVAVLGGHKFRGINLGNFHVCAVTTMNKAYCWGTNSNGQIGDGNTAFTRWSPVPVFGDFPFKSVTANVYAHHSCAITTSGKAYCWGRNVSGQLGDGTTVDKYPPVPVAPAM
jgi:alpha-tubulin suppressor-like RCC1 family protein